MTQKISVLINLDTFEKIKQFAPIVTSFESDVNIYHSSGYYDAKSIMAILALDVSKPRLVEIISDDEAEIALFIEKLKPFMVEETE